jgi:aconitate hydratase
MGFFPIDAECTNYLRATGRDEKHVATYEAYYKAQGLWGIPQKGAIDYSQVVDLDLSTVVPSVAGPKRPQDRIELPKMKESFVGAFSKPVTENGRGIHDRQRAGERHEGRARLRAHRRHHELHQHIQPERHARRGPARQEGR